MHPFSDPDGTQIFEDLTRSFVFVPGRRDLYVERVMGSDDELDLARQICLSECIISMASTITIDALSVGAPVINTCFDPEPDIADDASLTRFFAYDHFASLVKIVDLPVARNVYEV